MSGPQCVVVFVIQLDDLTAELRKVLVNQINHLLTREHCPVLNDTDIADGIDDSPVHVPQGCVTIEIGVVVKKLRVTRHFPDALAVDFKDFCRCGRNQTDKTVSLFLLRKDRQRQDRQAQKDKCRFQETHHSSLNFEDRPSLSKVQSLKIGSMTMRVDLIFSSRNLSMASTDFSCLAYSSKRL